MCCVFVDAYLCGKSLQLTPRYFNIQILVDGISKRGSVKTRTTYLKCVVFMNQNMIEKLQALGHDLDVKFQFGTPVR